MHVTRRAALLAGAAALAGCATQPAAAPIAAPIAAPTLNDVLDRIATNMLQEAPERATSLAVSEAQAGGPFMSRMSDVSREGQRIYRAMLESGLTDLRALDRNALLPQEKVSYDVVTTALQNQSEWLSFEPGVRPYVVTQLTGSYTEVPDFLASRHPIRSRADADAYLERLAKYPDMLDTESALVGADAAGGYAAPDFATDRALIQLRQFAGTAPAQTVLVSSFARRLEEVAEISASDRTALSLRAENLVRDAVLPAYARQIAALEAVRPRAVHDAGVWRVPHGAEIYASAVRGYTTTSLSPDEIHQMGLDIIAQHTAEMDQILRAQGMRRGAVSARVRALARRPEQLYPNTDAGREHMLRDLNAQVAAVRALMPNYFGVLARADVEVRRVPVYTEAGSAGGYYQSPALDGSRPGAYYINLRDTHEWPRYMLPTLTYHEAIPGHHWQIAIQQEAQGLPFIRSALLGFGAYVEGWGLYAEQLADEAGAYADNPLGRIGYLQSAVFRASRLVVDTGMHHKRWSKEQAVESMIAATGNPQASVVTEIERYSVWPGQALSYMVGREAIKRMREDARAAMGAQFDIRGFHDVLMTNGQMPLNVAQTLVQNWTASA